MCITSQVNIYKCDKCRLDLHMGLLPGEIMAQNFSHITNPQLTSVKEALIPSLTEGSLQHERAPEKLLLTFRCITKVLLSCIAILLFYALLYYCYIIIYYSVFLSIAISCSPLTHQPMYFFLRFLSLMDLCYTSTVTPKLIGDLLAMKKFISFGGCMTQLFTMHFFGGIEVFILTGMAYDCYVAICKPLHYAITMSRQRCELMMVASCVGEFLHSFGQFILAFFLPYCGPNEIDHYFCDVYPLLKLACMATSTTGLLVIANSGLMGLAIFVVLLILYAVILYTVKPYSAENRCKALSTCSSHITVVVLFFSPLLFIYIRPATTFPEDKVFALFYTIIAPMLNPLIYTLRNAEMKNATKKLWRPVTGSKRNRVKDVPTFRYPAP
ncbi:PREDICTED: olfactory receptor 4P4-like [Chinchilla lanigera]|uniref:olfactory receptor 4P4-like n=1 Tax=Chinchilla lanigera TaxID=34839 RepID=UPI000697362A|nr:PREDICTED: olfactory receptor 4P4-like [Chinchilla lanigera]